MRISIDVREQALMQLGVEAEIVESGVAVTPRVLHLPRHLPVNLHDWRKAAELRPAHDHMFSISIRDESLTFRNSVNRFDRPVWRNGIDQWMSTVALPPACSNFTKI